MVYLTQHHVELRYCLLVELSLSYDMRNRFLSIQTFCAGAFFMYTGLVVLGLLFVYSCLPETKGLQLEDIENLFTGRLCSCGGFSASESRYVHYIRVKGSNYLHSDSDASDVE